eukprot:TRINITY_DN356_c0_g1_i1.p1 TRINITY_DN356_c0_g1~~TRINITY_DN356_c0_g1_i1.p1  ORF type:complete len:217 (+),score=77.60 TRINITY_DN356_c0_g1_i1:222-872(+)
MDSRMASIVLACISLVSLIMMIVAGVLESGVAGGSACGLLSCPAKEHFLCDGLKHSVTGMMIGCIVGITLLSYCLIMHALQAAGVHALPNIMKSIARFLHALVVMVALSISTMVILFVSVPWGTECGINEPLRSKEGGSHDFGVAAWLCIVVFVLEIAGCIVSGSEENAPRETFSRSDDYYPQTDMPAQHKVDMQPMQPMQPVQPMHAGAPETTRL